MSDVTLRSRDVVVKGQLVVEGSDIHLTIDARRSAANTKRYRRALVHGSQDDLVVNYDNDYTGVVINGTGSGGITLNGATTIEGLDIAATINALIEEQERLLSAINVLERRAGAGVTPSAASAKQLRKMLERVGKVALDHRMLDLGRRLLPRGPSIK